MDVGRLTSATNSGSDRAQLANMAKQAKAVLKTETLDAVADRAASASRTLPICRRKTPIAAQRGSQALYDEAKKKNWTVISMKNDWKRVFAFDA